jgi:hypothetical protein
MRPWLTEREIAQAIAVHPETLRRLRRRGFGPQPEGLANNMPIYPRGALLRWRNTLQEHAPRALRNKPEAVSRGPPA